MVYVDYNDLTENSLKLSRIKPITEALNCSLQIDTNIGHHTTIKTPQYNDNNTHLTALCLGPAGSAGTRKVKPICIYWSKR